MRKLLIVVLAAGIVGVPFWLWHRRPKAPESVPPVEAPAPAPEPGHGDPAPAVPLTADEAFSKAQALSKSGKAAEAAPLYERALEADPSGNTGKRAAGALADHYAGLKMPRKALGYRLRTDLSSAARTQAEVEAKAMADTVFTGAPSADDLVVTVAPGETLGQIAKRHGTTPECLQRVNKLRDMHTIVAGQRLKVVRGTFRILVEKAARRLTVQLDGVPVRTYMVGIGAPEHPTPVTVFTIEEKVPQPPWHQPGQPPLPYGHPDNILGTRWMGFNRSPEYSGYGIHGTTKDESVGQASSNGCVRMHNADVEEVFDLVPRGTVVEIRD